MALNEIFRNADHLGLPVAAGVESGDVVTFGGNLAGIAQIDRDSDGVATVWFRGGYEIAVADGTYAVGDALYAHAAGGTAPVSGAAAPLVNSTATAGVLLGHAIEAKTTTGGTGTLRVRLAG